MNTLSNNSSSVLLYNVYIKNNWKSVTLHLLKDIPHTDIFINVSIDWYNLFMLRSVIRFLKSIHKVKKIVITYNLRKLGEVRGFIKLKSCIPFYDYKVLTYLHSKGVTKPHNDNVKDWVELMRYFIIEKYDLTIDAFNQGFDLYGINLGLYDGVSEKYGPYKFSTFHYSGNFVSVNLNSLREKILHTEVDLDYFGVEGFWGKLTNVKVAYNAHNSGLRISNHYNEKYPELYYKTNALIKP
jgi:hypothetical protein